MRPLDKFAFPLLLLVASTTSAWSADGGIPSTVGARASDTQVEVADVSVEAMIGQATLTHEDSQGQQESVVVPAGQAARNDPETGKVLLAPSTGSDPVNAVVQAIAAAAPDASTALPTDEGCSESRKPLRSVPRPDYDPEAAAAIEAQLAALSEGELMMVIAVLMNNTRHLCIDSSTVADTIGIIATIRPDAAASVEFVAALLDPEKVGQPERPAKPTTPQGEPPILPDIPPGGTPTAPSPE